MDHTNEPLSSKPGDEAEERDYRQRREGKEEDAGAKDRDRSRSPTRQPKKKDFSKGFGWKKKTPKYADEDPMGGYKDRAEEAYLPKRYGGKDDRDRFVERNRERDRNRENNEDKDRNYGGGRDRRFDRDSKGSDGHRSGRRRRDDEHRYHDRDPDGDRDRDRRKDEKPRQNASTTAQPEFIVVTVNDRLGTKARIPCLPSDTVGNFKKLVAAQIGRAPHEIMLKRQSQRPFRDALTLEDYEISNGVQLDLELDTGD